jgi:translin
MKVNLDLELIEKKLKTLEENYDRIHSGSRSTVRACSNAIKAVHNRDTAAAKKYLKDAEQELATIRAFETDFPDQLNHILQEYAEARIVLSAIEKKKIPSFTELKVGEVSYLNGLLDAIGELKREMYEALRKNNRKEAEEFFAMMEAIYDELLPLRFSNAILPDFRRKQDVARIQIEQARGELL